MKKALSKGKWKKKWSILIFMLCAHCLKIPQNVAIDFSNFWHFWWFFGHSKSKLSSLRWQCLYETFSVIFKHRVFVPVGGHYGWNIWRLSAIGSWFSILPATLPSICIKTQSSRPFSKKCSCQSFRLECGTPLNCRLDKTTITKWKHWLQKPEIK